MAPALHAFIDEAGARSSTLRSSDHFILAAVIIPDAELPPVAAAQARLRQDLRRPPGVTLHWQNLKSHSDRVHAARSLGQMPVTIASVVVCKRHIGGPRLPDEHHAYLYTLRFLLERLSWFANRQRAVLTYTLASIVRFKLEKLREYEAILRTDRRCHITWAALAATGGRIDQPSRIEQLQLADIAASGIFKAFEPDDYGNTEQRYLEELAPRLYRNPPGPLTSYGLKMHPWNDKTRAAYPWVAAL
jgi:hypothetical protein